MANTSGASGGVPKKAKAAPPTKTDTLSPEALLAKVKAMAATAGTKEEMPDE